jgi:hypothetical protein
MEAASAAECEKPWQPQARQREAERPIDSELKPEAHPAATTHWQHQAARRASATKGWQPLGDEAGQMADWQSLVRLKAPAEIQSRHRQARLLRLERRLS